MKESKSLVNQSLAQPIKAVLFGLGRVGMQHLKALKYQAKKARFELVAVVDLAPDTARQKLAGLGLNPAVYQSFDELMTDLGAELFPLDKALRPLFIFATPSGLHFEQAKMTIQAGAHLFLEKPVAMTAKEARELKELAAVAESEGIRTAVGHKYRYLPPFAVLLPELLAGQYGRPLFAQVSVRWGHDAAYYAPAWRGTLAMDGGALLNQSIHGVDLGAWLLGATAIRDSVVLRDNLVHSIEAEDFGAGVLRFDNGSYLALDGTTVSLPQRHEASLYLRYEQLELRASVLGKRVRLSILDAQGRELRMAYLKRYLRELRKAEGFSGLGLLANPHALIYSDLYRSIQAGKESLAPLAAGALAVEMTAGLSEQA
ncbi:MAG: Gfo/Idh/MocA family oxidoreductase [Eubacteriales bacterium]|nr:Gfo/Idh/MocA family oxidoreductase [Eubacteriales bacterium]